MPDEASRFLAELGTWDEGTGTFTFINEQDVGGKRVRQLVIPREAMAELPPEVTWEDIVITMLNPFAVHEEVEGGGGLMSTRFTIPKREPGGHNDPANGD